MALIGFDDAKSALGSKFTDLWTIVTGAWNDYDTLIPNSAKAIASPRSRASFVHDFMVHRALKLAETVPGVNWSRHQSMFLLTFQTNVGCLALRLKKLDEKGLSRTNPTQQVFDFRGQLEIPGIDAKHHLEVGYVLTPLQDAIQSVELVCPSGANNYWVADLHPTSASETVYNLWEHKGEEEQGTNGFTVKRRHIGGEDEEKSSNAS